MSFSAGRNLQNNINTTEAQTLSNKTLDSTNTIQAGATIQTPDIIDPNRSDVKKDTLANLQTYASTASNGQLVYATDSKKMYQVLDGALAEVGGGSAGINYISNPDAEVNADGWNDYANTTPGELPDDFGGSVQASWTNISASSSSPLRGSKSFAFGGLNTGATDNQGHGVYSSFVIDSADLAKKLTISFDYNLDDSGIASPVDGFLKVFIYDETNSKLIRVNGEDIQLNANNGTHYAQFQTDSTSTNYRLVIHNSIALGVDESFDMKMDNVQVGPREVTLGAAMTDWIDFTPTGSWTTNTTYTGKYRRIGDSAEIQYNIVTSGAPTSAILTLDMPSGLVADTTKFPDASINHSLGVVLINEVGIQNVIGIARYNQSTDLIQPLYEVASSQQLGPVTQAAPFTFGANDNISLTVTVPIQGWSSNATMSEDLGGREVVCRYTTTSSASIADGSPIIFDTLDFDKTNSYNSTTGVYTAPESGTYVVNASLRISANATLIGIKVNGTQLKRTYENNTDTGTLAIYDVFEVSKGDTIEVVNATGGSRTFNTGAQYNSLSIFKLASPQTILETETVAARYTSTSGQAINNTSPIMKYETLVSDTHNAYNTTTGEYTVPVSGWYQISGNCITSSSTSWTAGNAYELRLKVNGTNIERPFKEVEVNFTGAIDVRVSTSVYLEKDDIVTIDVFSSVATTTITSDGYISFSIARVK